MPAVVVAQTRARIVEALKEGACGPDERRIGQRVWTYGAQSYRPFGTAAQYTVVPTELAVPLPDHLSDELGADRLRERPLGADGIAQAAEHGSPRLGLILGWRREDLV